MTGEKVFYSRSDLHSFLRAHTRVINQHLRDHKPHRAGARHIDEEEYNPAQFAAANNTSMFMPGPINISAPTGSAAPMSHPHMMNASVPPMDRAPRQFQSFTGRNYCTICHRSGHRKAQCFSCPVSGLANRANAPWCTLCRAGTHKAPQCTLYGPGQDFGSPPCGKCYHNNFMAYHSESMCKGVDEKYRAQMTKYRENRRARNLQKKLQKNYM